MEAAGDQVGADGTVHVVTAFHPESSALLVQHLQELPKAADLVVVGSRGLGEIRRFLRGSVSARVALHAPMSVLIVHGHGDTPRD